jgi:hypothetical protein
MEEAADKVHFSAESWKVSELKQHVVHYYCDFASSG